MDILDLKFNALIKLNILNFRTCLPIGKLGNHFSKIYLPSIRTNKNLGVGGEGFEPPKASANGFTVRPGSPTPASAHF